MITVSEEIRSEVWYKLELVTDSKFSWSVLNLVYNDTDPPLLIHVLSFSKRYIKIFPLKQEKKVLLFSL